MRYLAVVALDQQPARFYDILGLAVVKPDGLDVFAEAFNAQGIDGLGGVGDGEQAGSGLVDADVGGLCRQCHGHE
ncbi:hypothetical protein D3C75_1226820 [compost metagenome]